MSSVERLRKRHASERRFRLYGLGAVWGVLGLLVFFLGSLVWTGLPALQAYEVRLDVSVPEVVPERARALRSVVRGALYGLFPEVVERGERRQLAALLGAGAEEALHARLVRAPGEKTVSVYLPVSGDADIFLKRGMGRISPEQARWLETLQESGRIRLAFNRGFFTSGDSRAPDRAGILGAIVGSGMVFMLLLVLVVPVGVLAAIYLEEFAPSNVVTDFFEINVNNLAAVPSIVFGLLGLAVFLNFLELPRSAPLVGGIVLALMTLPVIVITGRAALGAVPPSLREAALAIGASRMQMVFHHVLPQAMSGILTGTIIGIARALGETAPLLMIGMVAFIADVPTSWTSPATVLPVQIFIWSSSPEQAFVEKTSAAVVVLLLFILAMNALAIYFRRRFERR